MKKRTFKKWIPAGILAASLLLSITGNSQDRKLPDGTIIYSDGTRKLPNGTVIYKGGTVGQSGTIINLPDGSVVAPDGTRRYPKDRRIYRKNNGKGLPPGQAKKIYGGSAKDYAPGQQKKWKNKDDKWKDNDHNGQHENHGKGKGHKD